VEATYQCSNVNLKIMGIDFMVDLIVLKSSGIDVILGMNCLVKYDGMISCARTAVALTSSQGDRVEVSLNMLEKADAMVNQVEEKSLKISRWSVSTQTYFRKNFQVCHLIVI
jgi:hypothetical protein